MQQKGNKSSDLFPFCTTLTAVYLWGANLIKSGIGSTTSYYLYNAHGDVVQLTSATGTVTRTYNYDAFGNEDEPDVYDTNPFRYCGEYYDRESKTYYLRARYYDPALGRFTQQDSVLSVARELPNGQKISDPLSLNIYVYCGNEPLSRADPSGYFWETVLDILSWGSSFYDYLTNPTWKNAAYLLWDTAALLLPYIPGSYVDDAAKAGARLVSHADDVVDAGRVISKADDVSAVIKIATHLDDSIDAYKFAQSGNYLVGAYRDMKAYTKGYKGKLQAHHLLEQRFCRALKISIDDMISVVLTSEQHKILTGLWRDAIPYGFDYTIFKCWDDIKDIAKEVYRDYPELFALLETYMNSIIGG